MNKITEITKAPACAMSLVKKVNEAARSLTPLLNLKGAGGVQVTKSDADVTISARVGGAAIPPGVNTNDILDWSASGWVIHPAPPTTGKFILGRTATGLTWIPAEKCSAA